jgi:hypothetical protein
LDRYRCPECGVIADIDTTNLIKKITMPSSSKRGDMTFPRLGHHCELSKAISRIDFSKLEKL